MNDSIVMIPSNCILIAIGGMWGKLAIDPVCWRRIVVAMGNIYLLYLDCCLAELCSS